MTVTDPAGKRLSLGLQDDIVEADNCVWLTRVLHDGRRPMVLLALAPTADPETPAPHGCWTVAVDAVAQATGLVHVYVARQVANMSARRRGPDSHLFDDAYERERQWKAHPTDIPQSLVQRQGTLNGLATNPHPRLTVVAGTVLNQSPDLGDRAVARYSSSGPAFLPNGTERNPDLAIASDESIALRGIRAAGVRSGTSVRLVGTSTAAPQIGRKVANGLAPTPDAQNANPRRVGRGVITPMQKPPTAPLASDSE